MPKLIDKFILAIYSKFLLICNHWFGWTKRSVISELQMGGFVAMLGSTAFNAYQQSTYFTSVIIALFWVFIFNSDRKMLNRADDDGYAIVLQDSAFHSWIRVLLFAMILLGFWNIFANFDLGVLLSAIAGTLYFSSWIMMACTNPPPPETKKDVIWAKL